MSRYIDAYKKLTITVYDDEHEENIDRYMTIEEILDTYTSEGCPQTADVVEVVHGEWIMINEQLAKCSVCGGYESTNGKDNTGKGVIFKMQKKFCPHCGTDMRGGTE